MKKRKLRQTAYAGYSGYLTPPAIMVWSISGSARAVRMKIGNGWDSNWRKGWNDARRAGTKVIKVEITANA